MVITGSQLTEPQGSVLVSRHLGLAACCRQTSARWRQRGGVSGGVSISLPWPQKEDEKKIQSEVARWNLEPNKKFTSCQFDHRFAAYCTIYWWMCMPGGALWNRGPGATAPLGPRARLLYRCTRTGACPGVSTRFLYEILFSSQKILCGIRHIEYLDVCMEY